MRKYAERKAEPLFARLEDTILNRKVFQEWGSRRQVGIMIELRELLKYLGQLRLGTEEDRDEDLEEILAQSERYVKHVSLLHSFYRYSIEWVCANYSFITARTRKNPFTRNLSLFVLTSLRFSSKTLRLQ